MRIAIDFDGVIHKFDQGFITASNVDGGVVPGALDFVKLAIEAGHKVCIFSGRSCGPSVDNEELPKDDGGKAAIEKFLRDHGFPALSVHCRKPHADLFIDDLGWRFEGTFPPVSELEGIATPWYKRPRDAMGGLGTGNRRGKPKERKQDVLTPPAIVDFVRDLFNGVIALDPCATRDPRSVVKAAIEFHGDDIDGLKAPWTDRTYVNPPYKTLKPWLKKAELEAFWGYRVVVLCPVRPHREWWRRARDDAFYIELNPVAFIGYDLPLPTPLCLMVWGVSKVHLEMTLEKHAGIGVLR